MTHCIRIAGYALSAAVPPLGHQPGAFQHGHVFLHSGERHVVVRGEFAHRRIGVQNPRQNVAPRGIGERPEQLVQDVRRWLFIYNHLVVDSSTGLPGQNTGSALDGLHTPPVRSDRPLEPAPGFVVARFI
jgi:hypothetical protein